MSKKKQLEQTAKNIDVMLARLTIMWGEIGRALIECAQELHKEKNDDKR